VWAHSSIIRFTGELYAEAGEFSGPKMDDAIRAHYSPELAAKLVGKDHHADIMDEPYSWDESEEPTLVEAGFFLFCTEIDWQSGVITCDWLEHLGGSFFEAIFRNEEMFGTEFEDPHYTAVIEGLSFKFSDVELLLPTLELRQSSAFSHDARERRSIGRPTKWDWEGAMAHIVAEANTPDGLPTGQGAQARIEELISAWFLTETGNCPASSQVRQRAAAIMRMLERPKTPKTG
jgi:hypothetical protein